MIEMEQSIIKIKAAVYQRGGFSCWFSIVGTGGTL